MLTAKDQSFFEPISGFDLPRFAGVPTFMRLPYVPPENKRFNEVELGLIGVPWDAGTTNRPGPRHGPRQMRDFSTMIRRINPIPSAYSGLRAKGKAMMLANAKRCKTPKRTYADGAKV